MFYDTLTHPTLNGMWTENRKGQTFDQLYNYAIANDIKGCCAVGLPNVGDYDHKKYYAEAIKFSGFFYPVAAITKQKIASIIKEIDEITDYGFKAIKIHPRFLKVNLNASDLSKIFKKCIEKNIIVFYCSYYHCSLPNISISDPYWNLIQALKDASDVKILLLHGGGVELLKYCELARFNKNILIDLSLTLMKYDQSSIDNDIKFLFKNFDQRITIGSDHPEWEYTDIIKKINKLTIGLGENKKKNIFLSNVSNFLDLNQS